MTILSNELKQLIRHGSVYGLGTILSRLVGFLMIPLYTHYLNTTDYGIYQLVGITVDIIGIVLSFGISEAISRYYYEYKKEEDRNCVMSTACIGVTIFGFVSLGLMSLLSKHVAVILLNDTKQWLYIFLSILTLWFNQQVDLVYTYLRITEASKKYLVLSVAKLITAMAMNVFLIAYLNLGILGLFVSNLITAISFALLSFPILLKKVGLKFSSAIAKKMMHFSLPIVPANLASLVVNVSDRYFIKAFLSIADVGIYDLGYKFGSVVFYFVRVPFMQIWGPRRYALYNSGAPVKIFAKIATYFIALSFFLGLGISIIIQDVIKIIAPPAYWGAAAYAPAVVLCYIIISLDQFVAFGILIKKKTIFWTYVNFASAAINLLLNYLLISIYSVWGAVGSTFLTAVFKIISLHMVSRRLYLIPFEWGRMSAILIISIILYGLSIMIHPSSLLFAFVFDAFMIFMFIPLVWCSGIITSEEKKLIVQKIIEVTRKTSLFFESGN